MDIKQPEDRSHFILPDLGEGVHEAELIRWRVKPGERVKEYDILAEMETDKALVEVPSPWGGVIKSLHGNEGEILNVGSVLVEYEVSHAVQTVQSGVAQAIAAEPHHEDAGTVVGSVDSALTVSEAFTRRREEATDAPAGHKARATPAVRRLARESGIDINEVSGTGRGGRVTAADVEAHAPGAGPVAAPAARTSSRSPDASPGPAPVTLPVSGDGISERIAFRGVRRKIAESLDRSIRTAVHFTVVDEADVTLLEAKRLEYGRVLGRRLSLLPFVMIAVCRALRRHPTVNANVDDENAEILILGGIHLGCAVDTDHGLMVPVIEDADRLSPVELSDAVADVAAQCRSRTIPRERLIGGTFTISNVGAYGGMFATPIINYPEVAILAVGRARDRVMTEGGRFYAGRCLPLSMSCDHRVVDGAEGARFLNTVVELLQSPQALVEGP